MLPESGTAQQRQAIKRHLYALSWLKIGAKWSLPWFIEKSSAGPVLCTLSSRLAGIFAQNIF
jgi:hypothetical protein